MTNKTPQGRIKFVFRRPKDDQLVRFDVDSDTAQYIPQFLAFSAAAIVVEADVRKLTFSASAIVIDRLPVSATFFSVLGLVDHMICRSDLFWPSLRAVCARHVQVNQPAILRR